MNLDKPATLRELKKLQVEQFSEGSLNRNLDYEKGLISSEEFINNYLAEFGQLNQEQIINCWNAILVDFPRYRFQFIKNFPKKKTFN